MALLRARLGTEYGDVELETDDPQFFDADLGEAVRRFQSRHGLVADGLVGASTLQVLNVTPAERIDQIRINLERARWLREELASADDFVIVNIAGFYVRLFEGGQARWESRVIVGTEYDQTPIFAADMKYLVFNPTWSVPRSIIREEMIPDMKNNPAYLSAGNYQLLDAAGRAVSPASVDWSSIGPDNFPYGIVQQPGPDNALGRVKFMLPNEHAVYLHDTPGQELFARTGRTFSHGCVRTENPLEFAARLLADQAEWSAAAIDNLVASGETSTVFLSEPLRVFILYWTAEPAAEGGVRFYEDVYGRDAAVLEALNAPFRALTAADR